MTETGKSRQPWPPSYGSTPCSLSVLTLGGKPVVLSRQCTKEPLTAQCWGGHKSFIWLAETARTELNIFSYVAGLYFLTWKHPIIYLQIKCTQVITLLLIGSLSLYHLSLEWREGVGAESGQSCCGTNPVPGASWLVKADLVGNDGGLALLLALWELAPAWTISSIRGMLGSC